jgi:hypothetical protein
MEIGIIGLPQSGKTTLFHALAGAEKATAAYSSGRLEIHTAIAQVPDERVDILSKMFNPRKTIYAKDCPARLSINSGSSMRLYTSCALSPIRWALRRSIRRAIYRSSTPSFC